MNKFLLLTLVFLAQPSLAWAQKLDVPTSDDGFVYASIFAGNFSLLISLVIGVIATFLVFRSAKKLGGGLFGLILKYIGVGMFFIVVGTTSAIIDDWLSGFWFNIVSTAFFAMGYIFMVIGANKLLRGIMNT